MGVTKRFAAKLVIWSTMLATGGGGAYYATSSGRLAQLFDGRSGGTAAKLLADDSNPSSAGNLDAVASSWAAPVDSKSTDDSAESPIARSAAATLARADSAPTPPVKRDRYAVTPTAPTPASETATALDEPTPTLAKEIPVAVSDQEPAPELARGQDPINDDKALTEPAEFGSQLSDAATPAEPKVLDSPSSTNNLNSAAQRAREAFRDGPAAKAGTASTPASRYAASQSSALAAPGSSNSKENAPVVNPFVSQAASIPLSSAPAQTPDVVQPLPAASDASLNNAAAGFEKQSPSEMTRSARGAYAQPPSGYHAGENARPFGSGQNNQLGSGPGAGAAGLGAVDTTAGVAGTGKPGKRALEGPQKPALAIQKLAPPELQVGKPAKFVVQVRNVGGQAADDVTIRDEVPNGTQLVSTSPTAESDGSRLVWQLGKLSAGEERSIEMQVMPTAEGEIGSVATVTYSAQASVKARCTMPQLALRLTAPHQVMIGGEQRVKIELRNPGTGNATGVMLFENVPQNLKHAAGPALEFEIGTLRPGETKELELVLTAEKAGKVVNVLNARADGNLQVQQQVEFEVIAPALSVEVNGPERRYLERPATYEVTVANPGTAVAHDVQLVTKLPKGMKFVRANNMGEYDATSHAVYWSLAELPEGEHGTVELVAMPIETGPQTLDVESHAQQGLSDHKQQQIIVEGLAAIMFEVRDLEDPIEVGGETGYEIRVVNQGTKSATNLKVSVNLPPGMKVISAEGETRHAVQGGNIVFEPLAQLAPKANTVYRLKVQGVQAGDQRVTVEVNTDDLGQPIRREESTRVFGDQ